VGRGGGHSNIKEEEEEDACLLLMMEPFVFDFDDAAATLVPTKGRRI